MVFFKKKAFFKKSKQKSTKPKPKKTDLSFPLMIMNTDHLLCCTAYVEVRVQKCLFCLGLSGRYADDLNKVQDVSM